MLSGIIIELVGAIRMWAALACLFGIFYYTIWIIIDLCKKRWKRAAKACMVLIGVTLCLCFLTRPMWLSHSERLFRGEIALEEVFDYANGPYGFGGEGDFFQVYKVKGLEGVDESTLNNALKRRPIWRFPKDRDDKRFKWKPISGINQQESEVIDTLIGYQRIRERDSKELTEMRNLCVDILREPDTRVCGEYRGSQLIIYAYAPSINLLFYYACIL